MNLPHFRLPDLRSIIGALRKPKAPPAQLLSERPGMKWRPPVSPHFYQLVRFSKAPAEEAQKPVPAWFGRSRRHLTARRRAMAAHRIKRGCRA